MRLRIPTVTCGTLLFTCGLLLCYFYYDRHIYALGASICVVGVYLVLLAFLPSDRLAVPIFSLCVAIPLSLATTSVLALEALHLRKYLRTERCEIDLVSGIVPCWYPALHFGLRVSDLIPGCLMIGRILWQFVRKASSARLLAVLWSGCGWTLLYLGATSLVRLIAGLVVGRGDGIITPVIVSIVFSVAGLTMLIATGFRTSVQSWFMSRGEVAAAAAGVAELLGSRRIDEVLASARRNFTFVRADRIDYEHMKDNSPNPDLASLTEKGRLGFVDAFVSHSWHDDPDGKWLALQDFRREFKAEHGREPTLWIDKYSIDQNDIDDSLACLPVYLSGCQKLVILCGDTYLARLWCLIEIFVFLEMGGQISDLDVRLLKQVKERLVDETLAKLESRGLATPTSVESPSSTKSRMISGALAFVQKKSERSTKSTTSLREFVKLFDPRKARCYSQYDTDRLHAVIEATGYDRISRLVHDVFLETKP